MLSFLTFLAVQSAFSPNQPHLQPVGTIHPPVRALEAADIFWLEDFLHPENFEGYAEVSQATRTLRIAAGEQRFPLG